MSEQTEIKVGRVRISPQKREFLAWLDRFSRIPPIFKATLTNFQFTDDELELLKRGIVSKYKLKKAFLESRGA